MSKLEGKYTKSIFKNDSTGYYVGLFKVKSTDDDTLKHYVGRTITFTGYFHDLNEVDTYILHGNMINHNKYGRQFNVETYERCIPKEKDSIIEFLTSGLFTGIGEAKAKKIVDVLGKDTLKIILKNPDSLKLIPGISKKNIESLHKKLKEYEESYEIIIYLSNLGFSTKDAMLIYNKYKTNTKSIIEKDIYQVVDDINELSFKKVDIIALKMGVEVDSTIRLRAALIYIMNEVSIALGDCYYERGELFNYLPRVVGKLIDEDKFTEAMKSLEIDGKIVIKKERIYLREMYRDECYIVKRFRLLNSNDKRNSKKLDNEIHSMEALFDINYNKDQEEAIKKSYTNDFLIITGGPGTGKTTIMKAIIELYRTMKSYSYEKLIEKTALLAPTGRASKRISEATNLPASTIHRFLKWNKDKNNFQVNEYNKSKVEFIIIDEASMIDTHLMSSLLRGISSNCKIILIGDAHQLPSVGPGQVLHDLISSNKLNVVELTELYRQGKDSNIINLAYDIRRKNINKDIFNHSSDLSFIECQDSEVIPKIKEICKKYKNTSYKDFQILAPMYRGANGIDAINRSVREIFNPYGEKREKNIGDFKFREEDKVIQLTNMPDDNVYNGDLGIISRIEAYPRSEVYIDFDGNLVKYTPTNYNNFRQAYAISIHKAQGSEFDIVVIPIIKAYNKMLYQKLIYTGVTRAKKRLYLVGDFEALEMAARSERDKERRTTIKEYLINGID